MKHFDVRFGSIDQFKLPKDKIEALDYPEMDVLNLLNRALALRG